MRFDELKRINLRQVTEIMPGNPFSLDDERYISYALDQAGKGSDLEKALSVLNEALSSREPLTLDDVCCITDSYRQIEFLCGKETENFTPELCKGMAEEYVKHIRSADSVIRILKNNISMVAGNGEMKLKKQEALREYYEKRLAICRKKAASEKRVDETAFETLSEESVPDDMKNETEEAEEKEPTGEESEAIKEIESDSEPATEVSTGDNNFEADESVEEPTKAAEDELSEIQQAPNKPLATASDMMPETKKPQAVQAESLPQLPSGAAIPVFCEPFMNPYMQPYGVRYQQPVTPVNVVINNNIGSSHDSNRSGG